MPLHHIDHRTDDRSKIADLMTGFIHRDLGEWDRLRDLFHPDAMVHIMWFNGLARDFVDTLSRGGTSDLFSKHVFAAPLITFHHDRAVTETNAIILTENTALGYVCTTHVRFLDRVEAREGVWRLLQRRSVYDLSFFDVVPAAFDAAPLRRFPHEYAALAHLLTASGFTIEGSYPVRGGAAERQAKSDNDFWLTDAH